MLRSRRGLAALAAAVGIGALAGLPVVASGATTPGGGRAYELTSPPDKNGGDVTADSRRTRAAADGSAVGFVSLAAFADAVGTGVATDYLAVRSADPAPGSNGWGTHALTPRQGAGSLPGLLTQPSFEPLYVGDFSDDLTTGVFFARSALTGDSYVEEALNLYRRTDLRTPGSGAYDLLTACPLCVDSDTPLGPPASQFGVVPVLAGASPDFQRVIVESPTRLTSDTPSASRVRLYESDHGVVRLVGRIPTAPAIECDDGGGAPCVPYDVSIGGQGAGANHGPTNTPHTVSDGSDGHARIFFTTPTNAAGTRPATSGGDGNLYMRIDGTTTVQLNASERTDCAGDVTCGGDGIPDPAPAAFARARFSDASVDGQRAFFTTAAALTDDAPVDGLTKLYMYDASKSPSAPDNLTLLSGDEQPADPTRSAIGVIGLSDDGQRVYMLVIGQIVAGEDPMGATDRGVYLWEDGVVTFIGRLNNADDPELLSSGPDYILNRRQARVTPDGSHLLFSSRTGSGLLGYDHGTCLGSPGGCRELYVYDADADELACASCNPSGAPATAMATVAVREFNGGTQTSNHQTTAITDDGAHVFFSTGEALVAEDTNGRIDAYEYDVAAGTVHLLSSGTATSDSWFMDASADGRDAFFLTRQRLVGWDVDSSYDLYDARVGGGFPEPVAAPPGCAGDACQGILGGAPGLLGVASAAFRGTGNASTTERRGTTKPRAKRCKRGYVKKRVRTKRGKVKRKCVKRGRAARRARRARARRNARAAERRAARHAEAKREKGS